MAERIHSIGMRHGDPAGCVVCHGGDPTAEDEQSAHKGAPPGLIAEGGPADFYRDPGDAWIADRTCGQCHHGYAERWRKSVMSTGVERIERDLCAAARKKMDLVGDAVLRFGRYPLLDRDGPVPAVGTPAYKSTMRSLMEQTPADYSARLFGLAADPLDRSSEDLQAYCGTCHSRDASARSGCSVCHITYGTYQGLYVTIERAKPNSMTVHRIRGAGASRLTLSDGSEEWLPGIPLETCFQCHYDPRLVSVNGSGDAHVHYGGEGDASGGHLLCQDCHTSIEMHGNGNIPTRSAAQIEIRCEDCHGTSRYFPWELPLNFGDPEQPEGLSLEPRGLANVEGGVIGGTELFNAFLLTSKGNPFGNVVRVGSEVRLYAASGKEYKVTLLKSLAESRGWQSELSMQVKTTKEHEQAMTCLDCHADWQPPCLGCHEGDSGKTAGQVTSDDR